MVKIAMDKESLALSLKADPVFSGLQASDLKDLKGGGLAHDHILLGDTPWLLRVPRGNQLGLEALDYLALQAACFERAAQSGHTPSLKGILPPGENLPDGALIVQKIDGRRPSLPDDWRALAKALAQIHKLPVPEKAGPLIRADQPFGSQKFLLDTAFAGSVQQAPIDEKARALINAERNRILQEIDRLPEDLPMVLIGGDSHPANFLIDDQGKAWLLDIEFATYDVPLIDLADAGLAITAGLDASISPCRDDAQRKAFYKSWADETGPEGQELLDKYMPLAERIVEMRTILWLTHWLDQGKAMAADKATAKAIDNWDKMAIFYLDPVQLEKRFSPDKAKASHDFAAPRIV